MKLRIKELLKEKGKTQKWLAEEYGISKQGMTQMLNGNMTMQSLIKIAAILEVEPYELWTPLLKKRCPHCGGSLDIEITKNEDEKKILDN